ncbi:Ppx/GppA phosphatase family protein [Nocardiopsis valliformis]|uniref:Ppx/GppA phosphatase family protein n=1 Tax=Nocardiopsis valliformis TaxID=239974 RepID=UPI0003495817|nr:Ppx/GppA phosphatase family protein [Nocardiopsis valliformis]
MTGVAAIDCGTNSIRLLIADIVFLGDDEVQVVDADRRMEIVRLGQGVDETGAFAPEALERTFDALRGYAEAIEAHGIELGPDTVRMVATSATRDASNRQEFVDGVREILGVEPEVVTGLDEAELSFVGATAELEAQAADGESNGDFTTPFLVVDIGGGSTEFVLGGVGEDEDEDEDEDLVRASLSVNIGCVRMTERHLRSDPPTKEQVEAATADIDAALDEVEKVVPLREAGSVVCVAGTATTVAGIALDLPEYDSERIHHSRVSGEALERITVELLGSRHAERSEIGVMHPGRVDVIGAGALVLSRVLARTGADHFTASEHDILDGVAWSLIAPE